LLTVSNSQNIHDSVAIGSFIKDVGNLKGGGIKFSLIFVEGMKNKTEKSFSPMAWLMNKRQTRSWYTFYPLFEFFQGAFFLKVLALCMVSITRAASDQEL
jgi:hypothetical protein